MLWKRSSVPSGFDGFSMWQVMQRALPLKRIQPCAALAEMALRVAGDELVERARRGR